MSVSIYVGIGSNVDRVANVCGAVRALRCHFGELRLSRVYESTAVGFEGADFYNLVAGFDSGREVQDVAAVLRAIEAQHHRERQGKKFAPRTLDLDLLLYGEMVGEDAGIRIPRREILECAFVLRPLAEIAPELRHPQDGRTFAELWRDIRFPGQRLAPVEMRV